MTTLADLTSAYTSTTGTDGPLVLGDAAQGCRTFAAACDSTDNTLADGGIVTYGIINGNGARESGWGVYDRVAGTLTRNFKASSTGSPLNLTGQAIVSIDADSALLSETPVVLELTDDRGDLPTFYADGETPEGTKYIIPDLTRGRNFVCNLGTEGNFAVDLPPVLLLAPDVSAYKGAKGTITLKSEVEYTGDPASVVAYGPGWRRDLDVDIPDALQLGTAPVRLRVNAPFGIEGDPVGAGDVIIRYQVNADSRFQVVGPESTPSADMNPAPTPPPPPAKRIAFGINVSPTYYPIDDFSNDAQAFVDVSTLVREVRFLIAGEPYVLDMTSSIEPAPLHAYGMDVETSFPVDDANAYKAFDGDAGTGFGADNGNGSAFVFIDLGIAEDSEVTDVEVTLSESNPGVIVYVNVFESMEAFSSEDFPGGYWNGSSEYGAPAVAGEPITINLSSYT